MYLQYGFSICALDIRERRCSDRACHLCCRWSAKKTPKFKGRIAMSIRQMPKGCRSWTCLRIYLLGPYSPFDNVINRNRTANVSPSILKLPKAWSTACRKFSSTWGRTATRKTLEVASTVFDSGKWGRTRTQGSPHST
jgi:hypothetical protein